MVGVTHPVRLIASSHCMLIASDCAACRWASRWDLYLYMGDCLSHCMLIASLIACRWASRWDLYLYMGDDQIHWFSILNSLAIVLLLTGTRFGSDCL